MLRKIYETKEIWWSEFFYEQDVIPNQIPVRFRGKMHAIIGSLVLVKHGKTFGEIIGTLADVNYE